MVVSMTDKYVTKFGDFVREWNDLDLIKIWLSFEKCRQWKKSRKFLRNGSNYRRVSTYYTSPKRWVVGTHSCAQTSKTCLTLDTMTYPADVQHHRAPYHDRLLHLPAPPSCYLVISTPPKTRDALLFWRELRPLCLFLYSPYPPPHHPPAARRPRMTEARKADVDVPGSSARQKTNTCRITFLFVFQMF